MSRPDPTPDLDWTAILLMFDARVDVWETDEPQRGPWPNDPDGGELRVLVALRKIVQAAALADEQGLVLPTADIRRLLTRELTR